MGFIGYYVGYVASLGEVGEWLPSAISHKFAGVLVGAALGACCGYTGKDKVITQVCLNCGKRIKTRQKDGSGAQG